MSGTELYVSVLGPRFAFVLLLVTGLFAVTACGSSAPIRSPLAGDVLGVPRAVIESAESIAAAARREDLARVGALAGAGKPLPELAVVLDFAPGRRLSPFGNGAVQELWVFPALALIPVSEWTEADINAALSRGLVSADQLAEYRAADIYLGYSVGMTPEGGWVFCTAGRVAETRDNPRTRYRGVLS